MNDYYAFSRGQDLLNLIGMCHRAAGPKFPRTLLCTGENEFSVPVSLFPKEVDVQKIVKQLGGNVYRGPRRDGKEVELANAIALNWRGFDPVLRGPSGWRTELRSAGGSGNAPLAYVLASRNSESNQTLLGRLQEFLVERIDVRPVQFPRDANSPFEYFWRVSGDVPISVLRSAEMVWWSASISGNHQIFLRWPYELTEDPRVLEQVDWCESNAFVLLSGNPPQQFVVSGRSDLPHFDEMHVFAHLSVEEQREPLRAAGRSSRKMAFPVRVNLIEGYRSEGPLKRRRDEVLNWMASYRSTLDELNTELLEINEEIHEIELSQSADVGGEFGRSYVWPEQLYFYREVEGKVPEEIQRLLIEWSHQPSQIETVQYMKVTASSDLIDSEGRVGHLLTTSAAIGQSSSAGLGARLRAYRPRSGQNVSYEMAPEWVPFGLRLFLPSDSGRKRIRLYPRLRPCELAAEALAKAFGLPESRNERTQWGAILQQCDGTQVRSWPFSVSEFRPLMSSIDWQCNLEVRVSPKIVHDKVANHQMVMVNSIVTALETGITDEVRVRLNKVIGDLKQKVTDETKILQQRRQAVKSMAEQLKSIEQFIQRCDAISGLLGDSNAELHAVMAPARRNATLIGSTLKKLTAIETEIGQLSGTQSEVRARVADIQTGLGLR
jgi:hypothetical protein